MIPDVKAVKLQRFKTRHKPPFAQREDVTRLNLDVPNEMEVGTIRHHSDRSIRLRKRLFDPKQTV